MRSVFVSIDHRDQDYLNAIRSIHQNPNNPVTFIDRSLSKPVLNEHGHVNRRSPKDPKSIPVQNEIEPLLHQSSKFLVLIGKDTHSSEWVKWEIGRFREIKKKPDILLMRVKGEQKAGAPNNAKQLSISNWNIDELIYWLNH